MFQYATCSVHNTAALSLCAGGGVAASKTVERWKLDFRNNASIYYGELNVKQETPTVCAVMLTADRPELAKRAVECFRRQTYPNKTLLIYDTGTDDAEDCPADYPLIIWIPEEARRRTIGELRNAANSHIEGVEVHLESGTTKDCGAVGIIHWADIIIHWDDDDYSHPNRIAEQVALLQSSGPTA